MPGRTDPASLASAAWPEVADRPLVLVPVGSVEQHGPALPLATDTTVAEAVTRGAVARVTAPGGSARRVLAAPALAYGASGEHEGFPGTISIGHEALRLVLVEYARSACRWAGAVVFVNGHGGNAPTVVDAVRQLRGEGRAVAWTPCAVPGGDAHAGATETALLLHLAPDAVRTARLEAGVTEPLAALMPRLRAHGVRAVSPNGVLGDPAGATADDGRRILDAMVERVVAAIADFAPAHTAGGPPPTVGADARRCVPP